MGTPSSGRLPLCQHPIVVDGELIARADFAWPRARLVLEADGYTFHSDRRAWRNDQQRHNRLLLAGWQTLRLTWEDVASPETPFISQLSSLLELGGQLR